MSLWWHVKSWPLTAGTCHGHSLFKFMIFYRTFKDVWWISALTFQWDSVSGIGWGLGSRSILLVGWGRRLCGLVGFDHRSSPAAWVKTCLMPQLLIQVLQQSLYGAAGNYFFFSDCLSHIILTCHPLFSTVRKLQLPYGFLIRKKKIANNKQFTWQASFLCPPPLLLHLEPPLGGFPHRLCQKYFLLSAGSADPSCWGMSFSEDKQMERARNRRGNLNTSW